MKRTAEANAFIEVIASCGRKFFRHEDRVACFHLDSRGRLWFTDAYSRKAIYVAYRHEWRGFSNGGTLRSLTENLGEYIRHGKPLWMGYFEPMRDGSCRWAYGEDAMRRVREAAEKFASRDCLTTIDDETA